MEKVTATKQPANILIQDSPSLILTFDAAIQENHSGESDVTEYPVEEGADNADHVRPKPLSFRMEAMVSDFPIIVGFPNSQPEGSNTGASSGSRVQDAYGFLEKARLKPSLVTVFTKFRTYDDMVIQSISVSRSSREGRSAVFDLSFRQIKFGQVELTKAPRPSRTNRKPKENKGAKQAETVEVTELERNQSLASQGVEALANFIVN